MRHLLGIVLICLATVVAGFADDTGVQPVQPNVQLLAPGPIGSTTPNTGAFTTLSSSTAFSTAGSVATSRDFAATNSPQEVGTMTATTSGTAADGFGGEWTLQLEASTGASFAATTLNWIWTDATTASRSSAFWIGTRNNAGSLTEGLRVGPDQLVTCASGLTITAGSETISATTDSTSTSTGALKVSGGGAFAKNLVAAQGLGVGVTSTVTAATTTTLTTSTNACQVFTGTTTQTLQLPAANAFGSGVGYVVYVKNLSTGAVTVQRAGADTINSTSSNVTSFTLAQWASCTLYSDGSAAWERF